MALAGGPPGSFSIYPSHPKKKSPGAVMSPPTCQFKSGDKVVNCAPGEMKYDSYGFFDPSAGVWLVKSGWERHINWELDSSLLNSSLLVNQYGMNTSGGFKIGDEVKLRKTSGYYGGSGQLPPDVVGVITRCDGDRDIEVTWGRNESNTYGPDDLCHKAMTVHKASAFDLTKLNPLVIDKAVKEEIEAVLKQHKNKDKLFVEWGLGETIEYGKGMTFLFYGPPGTGKTWAASCMAKVVGQELLSIGAAEIQSSEPGGANRAIQEAFKAANEWGKILFIDECDSLITSRADLGMVLGGEVNTLLTEIEKAEGIVILATNRIENLDEALERRISLIVEFPEPDHGQRQEIFKKLIPKKMPLAKDVSMEKLAENRLTGGQIKNVIVQAARLALSGDAKEVKLAHFESAIKRVQKSKSLMGSASRYSQTVVREGFGKSVSRKVQSDDLDISRSPRK